MCGHSAPPLSRSARGHAPESALLGHLYAAALRYYGTPAVVTETDGCARRAGFRIGHGAAGVHRPVPDRAESDGATARADEQVYRDLLSALPEGVAAGDYTMSAQDKPALVVTEATAKAWGGTRSERAARATVHRRGRVRWATPGAPQDSGLAAPRPRRS